MPIAALVRLLVIYQHAPTPGAPGIYRHRMLLAELVRRGWDVDLVSSPINYMDGSVPERYRDERYVREQIDGITHHWVQATDDIQRSFKRRARNYVTFAWNATLRGMRLERPDIVWASSPPLSVATAGRWIARRHRAPLALEVRDLWPESAAAVGLLSADGAPYRVIDRFARTYAREADLTIVPTPGLVVLMRGHGSSDVTLVTGAIEDRPPADDVRARWRERLGVADDDCLFAYVGAHGVINGLDVLFDALELVRADPDGGPRVRVVTAGSGSATAALTARLDARPIAGLDVLGPIPKQDARDLLAGADVGLHLLRPDPVFASALPTKVLEYLGCHLPFITTVPGLPGDVAAATGGDLAPDAAQLADALRRWADRSPATRRSIGDAAFGWGEERYGLAASVDTLEGALRAAISAGRGVAKRRQAREHPDHAPKQT
ncbi:MAG: putative glycosyltransferase [Thermoleophilia bacterium]|nr:putative glycosyltransferase [Thermoleophilia bacterium]